MVDHNNLGLRLVLILTFVLHAISFRIFPLLSENLGAAEISTVN